jgi:phosphate transport system substrate-binding protein
LLKQVLGAIAYVDFQYAAQNQVPFGSVLNSSGKFIKANLASLAAASSSIKNIDDFRVSISNAPGVDAYPISSFTWIVVPVHSRSTSEGMDLREFLRWMLMKRSQAMASGLGYAPLTEELAARIDGALTRIR